MSLIPGMIVHNVNRGCSGMAGTWGLHQKNYRNSLRIGWPLITTMRREMPVLRPQNVAHVVCRSSMEAGV